MKLVAKRSSIIDRNCLDFVKVPAVLRALPLIIHAYSYSKKCLFLALHVIIGQQPIYLPIKQVFLNGPGLRWSKQYVNIPNNSSHVTNQHAEEEVDELRQRQLELLKMKHSLHLSVALSASSSPLQGWVWGPRIFQNRSSLRLFWPWELQDALI